MGKGLLLKIYHHVSLLSVVSKVFERLDNNGIFNHLEKCVLFSNFQYGFRFSRSTPDLLTVVSNRTVWSFNRSEANQALALDISTSFDRLWHAAFFTILSLIEFQVRYLAFFLLFSATDRVRLFCMGSLHSNIQLMLEFLMSPFLVLYFSYYTLMIILIMLPVILLSMMMILLSNLSVITHLICSNN